MARRLVGLLVATLVGGTLSFTVGTAAAAAQPAPAPAPAAIDFAGTVSLSNCSGSVVRLPQSAATDPALVLSNGHCLETGFPAAGEVIVNRSSSRTFGLLNGAGTRVATLRATKIAYATMTDTDASLYQLSTTYAQIEQQYRIKALEISPDHPTAGTDMKVVSGYWKRIYTCKVDGFAYRLREGQWTWKDSIRYTSACQTIGGTSGSPVLNVATGKVIGVNNTGNEDGARCTDNNPCEVDEAGNVTVRHNINYGQQTYQFVSCFAAGNKLDLSLPNCKLPKPRALEAPAAA